ncbi:GNAT family N-acetyltransferase [bacterium]|nr:GNAT family N-acetyltransferase [bacterium]
MLESERLLIYPVSDEKLKQIIENESNGDLKQAYAEMLDGCLREPEKRIWHALWFIELKERSGTVVGDISFKGLSAGGSVELGYGLREGFCGKGYMTEAVKAIAEWALAQSGVTCVEAETEPDNVSSQRVLARAGFAPTGVMGEEGPKYAYVSARI